MAVDLRLQLVVDAQPLLARRLAEQLLVQAVEAAQLVDRRLVIVDAEVDEDVGEAGVAAVALDDDQRRGLLAALVAARRLRRRERLDQALGERSARLERLRERVDGVAGDEDVPLRGVAVAGAPAGPVEAGGAGVGRTATLRVDDAELPLVAAVVGLGQPPDDLLAPTGPAAGARARRARSAGSRRPASRRRRPPARPTARPSRRRGTSTASRRPTARGRGRRRRSSTSRSV